MYSDWYSGYYNVSDHRYIHYLMILSEYKPLEDPVIVYFNGGPGAASIENAFSGLGPVFMRESGPERFNFTWTKNATLIFVDNPAGVGFSYARRPADNIHSDFSYQRDALTFMIKLFADNTELRDNPLYICGISYGGLYAPYLTWALHQYN